jgi:hypothetical protein
MKCDNRQLFLVALALRYAQDNLEDVSNKVRKGQNDANRGERSAVVSASDWVLRGDVPDADELSVLHHMFLAAAVAASSNNRISVGVDDIRPVGSVPIDSTVCLDSGVDRDGSHEEFLAYERAARSVEKRFLFFNETIYFLDQDHVVECGTLTRDQFSFGASIPFVLGLPASAAVDSKRTVFAVFSSSFDHNDESYSRNSDDELLNVFVDRQEADRFVADRHVGFCTNNEVFSYFEANGYGESLLPVDEVFCSPIDEVLSDTERVLGRGPADELREMVDDETVDVHDLDDWWSRHTSKTTRPLLCQHVHNIQYYVRELPMLRSAPDTERGPR